jgi:MtN3 and saliva related transmembrane protein
MPPSIIVEALGAAAAVCSTTSFVPQLIKLVREKTAESISLRMYALTVTAFVLWSGYGLMLKSWPLVFANLVSLALSATILALQLRYHGRGAPDPRLLGRQTASPRAGDVPSQAPGGPP